MESYTLTIFAAVIAMIMASSSAIVVLGRGSCPRPGTLAGFDSIRYLGVWYEYERFANWFEVGLKCVTATYGDNGDGPISVTNAGRGKLFGRLNSIEGKATIPDPAKPAELSVAFGGVDMGSGPNYYVVDTDYNNYAVVFSCSQLGFGTVQFAWILTRTAGVAPSNLASIKSNLANAGINVNKFLPIDQTNCS